MIPISCSLLACAVATWAVAAAGCPSSSSPVLSAMVPLHSGVDCAAVNLRGVQQLGALRRALADVNADLSQQDGLTIGLRWEDSCASDAGAVSAALRLLVDAQQTCPNPPFHMGMVGPEGESQLSRVLPVTGVFNVTHVLARATHSTPTDAHHAVLSVTVDRLAEQAQSVLGAVRRLGWRGFRLAYDGESAALAEAVARLANEDAAVCVKGPPTAAALVPSPVTGSDGSVVLVEGAQAASLVLGSPSPSPLLLVVRQVGLESWQLPPGVFLLQRTSSVTEPKEGEREGEEAALVAQLAAERQARCTAVGGDRQRCQQQDVLSELTDESAAALSDGVRLLAAALRASRHSCDTPPPPGPKQGCVRTSAAEWRGTLRRMSATRRAPDHTRIRFNMDQPSAYALYTRHPSTNGPLVQLAAVSAGVLQQTLANYSWPPMSPDAGQCDGPPPPTRPPAASAPPPLPPTLKDLYTTEYAFYELVGMICAVGFIMFAVMVVIIYVIYNSLVEKGDKESTGGSIESRGGSVAATARSRPPRRNLRDTFRRGSSIRSSTHS